MTGRPERGTSSRPAARSSSRTRPPRCSPRCRARSRRRSSTRRRTSTAIGAVLRDLLAAVRAGARRPRGPGVRRVARPDPGAERHRLQHLQARDHHPAIAGPDGRDGAHHARRLREAAGDRPGGVRQAHQQPPDQGHRVLPGPEGLPVPARPGPAGTHRGRAPRRPATAGLVGRAARPARRPTRSRSRLSEAIGRRRAGRRARVRDRHRPRRDRVRPPRDVPARGAPERRAAPAGSVLHRSPTAATRW